MTSRRSFLAATATGAAAAIAGCSVLDVAGDTEPIGGRWITAEIGSLQPDDESLHFDEFSVTSPARAAAAEGLADDLFRERIAVHDLAETGVPDGDVHRTVACSPQQLRVTTGDFSADAIEAAVPEAATEVKTDLDATVSVEESSGRASRTVYVHTDGVYVTLRRRPNQPVESAVSTVLSVTENGGYSLVDSGPMEHLDSFLEDGFYGVYRRIALERPYGLTVSLDGGQLRRRVVVVHDGEAEAKSSRFLQDAVQSQIEGRHYRRSGRDVEPLDSLAVERDGAAIKLEATLPVETAAPVDFSLPLEGV